MFKTIFISNEIVLFVNEIIEKKLFNLCTKIYFLLVFIYSQIENSFELFIIIIGLKDNEKSIYMLQVILANFLCKTIMHSVIRN